MKIGVGYCRRAARATLASVGLVIPIIPLHMRSLGFQPRTGLTHKAPRRLRRARPGQTESGVADRGLRSSRGAFVAPGANGIRNLGHVCNWETQDWDDLTDAERQAFQILGWSRATWDGDNEDAASASGKPWSKLIPKRGTPPNLSGTARKIGTSLVRVTFPSNPAQKVASALRGIAARVVASDAPNVLTCEPPQSEDCSPLPVLRGTGGWHALGRKAYLGGPRACGLTVAHSRASTSTM